uniref:Uncharacterized protein n=1 Tax=Arundo donax TaxID=35708 RepID=A0A0A8XX30_ARUDO
MLRFGQLLPQLYNIIQHMSLPSLIMESVLFLFLLVSC